jgi:hypothetical protein
MQTICIIDAGAGQKKNAVTVNFVHKKHLAERYQ